MESPCDIRLYLLTRVNSIQDRINAYWVDFLLLPCGQA